MNFIEPFLALLKCNPAPIWTAKLPALAKCSAVLLCCACASSPPAVDTNVKIDFPSTAIIVSEKQADEVLKAVALSSAQIEWRYRQMEQICYTKFFMNSCLLDAKELRRLDLARVNKSEVEANFFKRKHKAEELDKALVERNKDNPLPGVMPEIETK